MIFKESYIEPIQKELTSFFWKAYFEPLREIMKSPVFNSSSAMIEAIRSGKIQYRDNKFTGTFNIKLSKELSKYAEFNRLTKTWTVTKTLPSDIRAAAVTASHTMDRLIDRINKSIDQMESYIPAAIEDLTYPVSGVIGKMTEEADRDVVNLGLVPVRSIEWEQNISERYNENMDFYVQKWHEEEITRMRDMIERATLQGVSRRELEQMIVSEWDVTQNKARFLARNETMLLSSSIRDERYQDAGVERYKWSTAQDERVRDDHKDLNGKVFSYRSPPIIDKETGTRGNPGQYYNCRCSAIPVL